MEHTPKNILIRAVYQGSKKDNQQEINEILEFLHVTPDAVSGTDGTGKVSDNQL